MPSTEVDPRERGGRASDETAAAAPRSLLATLRSGGRPLGAFLVLALGLKLLVVMAALGDDPLAHHPTSDSLYYLERAAGLAGLIADPLANEPYHLPPLYPQVLARVPGALQGSFGGVFVLQAVFGTAALLGVYLLARRRAGAWPALAAAGLTLLYGPLTFFELKLLGDSLACSLLVFALVVTDRLADGFGTSRGTGARPGWHGVAQGALLGILLALATLLRPQVLLLIPVWVGWLLVRRARGAALACALGAVLLLTPSTLHNVRAGGGLTPVSDNGGVNLWLANAGPVSGTFLTYDEAFGDIGRQADSARAVAENMAGRALTPGEVSDTLRAAAWDAVWDDPAVFMTRLSRRAQASLESFETGIVCVPEVEASLIGPLKLLALPFGVLLALGGASLVILGGRRRVPESGARPGAPVLPMLSLAGLVFLTTLIFFHYSRFRLPLIPLLAVCIAVAVDRVMRQGLAPGRGVTALLAAGALAWISWLPGEHHDDTRAIGWTSLAEARIARAGNASGAARQAAMLAADADMARALEHAPALVRARLSAHRVALALGRFEEASEHLDAVAAVLPDHTQVLMNRAWLHVWQDPRNPYFDTAAARALLEKLQLAAVLDAELAPHVRRLEARVFALEQSPAGGH